MMGGTRVIITKPYDVAEERITGLRVHTTAAITHDVVYLHYSHKDDRDDYGDGDMISTATSKHMHHR